MVHRFMKIQDVGFIVIFASLLLIRKERWIIIAGLVSLALAIPLFAYHVFFTAERLTWYGAAFLLVGLLSPYIGRKGTL